MRMAAATLNGSNYVSATRFVESRGEGGEETTTTTTKFHGKSASPRFEAFVMTGDKILRLNSKISPHFALLKQSELPEHTEILESPTRSPVPEPQHQVMSKWPHRQKQRDGNMELSVPNSRSENAISTPTAITLVNTHNVQADSTDEDSRASCATVNAMCPTGGMNSRKGPDGSNLPSPTSPFSFSEPVSPAKLQMRSETLANHHQELSFPLFKDRHTTSSGSGSLAVGSEPKLTQTDVETSVPRRHCEKSTATMTADFESPHMAKLSASTSPVSDHNGHDVERISVASLKEPDVKAATRLAKRLYNLEGFRPTDVSAHLTKNNDFNVLVAREYLHHFNFSGLRLDAALRLFCSHFCITGETSARERIVSFFSHRYHECNPGVFKFEDEVHTLAFALLLLNSDLHGAGVATKMSCREFIDNVCHSGPVFPRDNLKVLYSAIKANPLESPSNGLTNGRPLEFSGVATDEHFLEIPDPESQVEYHKGWVMRKSLVESDGSRTPRGRRGWKMFYATLKGVVMYLHKDEHGFRHGAYQTFQNAIRVHHSLATRAGDYVKKQHVFRLQTASLAEFLFQTSDPEQLQLWIDSINLVSACFSSPPLPAPVGFTQKLHRPVLPSSVSKLSMKEQLNEHRRRIDEVEELLDQHRETVPPRNAKPRILQDYAETEIYYQHEIRRYRTYVLLLESKIESKAKLPDDHYRCELTEVRETADDLDTSQQPTERHCEQSRTEDETATSAADRCSYKIAIYSSDSESTSIPTVTSSYETAF